MTRARRHAGSPDPPLGAAARARWARLVGRVALGTAGFMALLMMVVTLVPAVAGAQAEAGATPSPSPTDASPEPTPSSEPSPSPEPVPTVTPTSPLSPPRPSAFPTPPPWEHDHSSRTIPARPTGVYGLRKLFGRPCGGKANNARTYYPSAGGRGKGGYLYYHQRLALNIGHNVVGHITSAGKRRSTDYGVWGYACRAKTGGTTWSVHSWGAAIDTNTLRNPWTQRYWNGRGSNGRNFYRYLPNVWIRHNFYWGLWWSSTKDPMHFQYVSGY